MECQVLIQCSHDNPVPIMRIHDGYPDKGGSVVLVVDSHIVMELTSDFLENNNFHQKLNGTLLTDP